MTRKLDWEEAAQELKDLIDEADADTLACLYEYAFGAVKTCEQSDAEDCFIVEYHEGLEPNA